MCLVGLEHVAAAKCAEDAEDREHNRKELATGQAARGKALGHIVHRTTGDGAVVIFVAVFYAERTFREFRCHAHQAGKDHPEGCPRTTDADGNRHTRNIPKAHSARERRCQCLKMADFARVVGIGIVPFDQCDRMREGAELDQPEVQREDGCRDHQPGDDPGKAGAGEGAEDEVDEPAGGAGKQLVHLLVDGLGHQRAGCCKQTRHGQCGRFGKSTHVEP